MPAFSKSSKRRLETCDLRLQAVLNRVIEHFDCTVLEGHRGRVDQNEAVRTGRSKVSYPNGKHNSTPSFAVDVVPYPINWTDTKRFCYFAGIVVETARAMGITLRWGGDWNRNTHLDDQTFHDLPHFEIVEE